MKTLTIPKDAVLESWGKKKHVSNHEDWESLPEKTKFIIRNALLEAAENRNGPEGYKLSEDCLEEIEHISRDGFIPSPFNQGGLIYRNFTDLMGYFGSGHTPAHKKAAQEIERQIDNSFKYLAGETYKEFKDRLDFETKGISENDCNYHWMHEAAQTHPELEQVAKYIEEGEMEMLSDENSSIMHELRFMYHGKNRTGTYSASISAAINTEGPYHRSHISWSPDTFCEGAKEVTIRWKTDAELQRKLKKAFQNVSKAIF